LHSCSARINRMLEVSATSKTNLLDAPKWITTYLTRWYSGKVERKYAWCDPSIFYFHHEHLIRDQEWRYCTCQCWKISILSEVKELGIGKLEIIEIWSILHCHLCFHCRLYTQAIVTRWSCKHDYDMFSTSRQDP